MSFIQRKGSMRSNEECSYGLNPRGHAYLTNGVSNWINVVLGVPNWPTRKVVLGLPTCQVAICSQIPSRPPEKHAGGRQVERRQRGRTGTTQQQRAWGNESTWKWIHVFRANRKWRTVEQHVNQRKNNGRKEASRETNLRVLYGIWNWRQMDRKSGFGSGSFAHRRQQPSNMMQRKLRWCMNQGQGGRCSFLHRLCLASLINDGCENDRTRAERATRWRSPGVRKRPLHRTIFARRTKIQLACCSNGLFRWLTNLEDPWREDHWRYGFY